jgi:hypothetical protein
MMVFVILPLTALHALSKEETSSVKVEATKTETAKPEQFKSEQQKTKGSVAIGGKTIDYDAYAGTLIVHPKDWDDVPQNADPDPKNKAAEASMFYVAYFRSDTQGAPRPLTFLFNGGPGSSTVWLHMGAFGPKRVVTLDDSHTPAAAYSVVNNEYSCSTQPISISSTRQERASAASAAKTKKRPSTASIRMPGPSPTSSCSFSQNTAARIRPTIFSGRAMAPRGRPCSPTSRAHHLLA